MEQKFTIEDFLQSKRSHGPSLSPDGSTVAFLSNLTGHDQLYVKKIDGDTTQLTDFEDRVMFGVYSPVDDIICFGKDSGGDEKTQLFLIDCETKKIQRLTNAPETQHQFGGWSEDGKFICYSANENGGKDFHAYVMDVESGQSKRIFSPGGMCLSQGFSPDGAFVVVSIVKASFDNDLYLINLKTGEAEHITKHEGGAVFSRPQWLDNKNFLARTDMDSDLLRVINYDGQTKNWKDATVNFDFEVELLAIDKLGQHAALVLNQDGYSVLKLYSTSNWEELPCDFTLPGVIHQLAWSEDGEKLVFDFAASDRPTDVWLWTKQEGKAKQVSFSPSGAPQEILVQPRLAHYTSFDNLKIPVLIYEPKNSSGKVPAIVSIHGGPEGQSRPGTDWLTQYFVHAGYAVIVPNVRGSSGYGKHYMALDNVRKRMDSVKDLESLHQFITTDLPHIDGKKIALLGGSYGGFMVLAGLAFQPQLWAAGIEVVGISNWVTFLENTSVWRRSNREQEYGNLENDREFLESISPLNFAENITAPLFIIHGANDPRVPLSEAQQLKQRLDALGRTTELLVYQDEGHGLVKLKNKLDAFPKVVGFLKNVLGA